MKMSLMWIISILMLMLLLMAIQMAQKKMQATKEKWMQFECGFNMMTPPHIPFSFQFFLVAILFLIFDVEIALILSYPTEFYNTKNTTLIFLFLTMLTFGLLYEWQKSKIEWNK